MGTRNMTGPVFFSTGVKFEELVDTSLHPPKYQYRVTGRKKIVPSTIELGKYVVVNKQQIALFRFKDKIYALDTICSHAGGNLHLGDIEDIDGTICVSCPRHRYCFSLQSGKCLAPETEEYAQKSYPVRITKDGIIQIGFEKISESIFSDLDF